MGDPVATVSELEKWTAEKDFRERELKLREAELEISRQKTRFSQRLNPLVLAIVAAALAAGGNAIVTFVNGNLQRDLESQRAEQTLILEVIKVGGGKPDKAAENLDFLIKTGLIHNPALVNTISHFLDKRIAGTGPSLPYAGEMVYGCMDPSADNYNPKATNQAGTTCLYTPSKPGRTRGARVD